jgi:UDP-N-acetylglucosamine--N-acetylmuramyl-(pentapeptide) pyrophosphoryl-undecaprenol N-acetylglucosamine transferase
MPKILIMAGGTGGHIFPGLAVAQSLRDDGWDIDWLGTADKMEATIVPKHDISLHTIAVKGIRGNGLIRKLSLPFMLLKAVFQAHRIMHQIQPDVVLGMGGYASGPGGIAARILGIPLVLHEQNAVAGMTNRYLAKIAKRVLTGFANTPFGISREKITWVGNPVRAEINAIPAITTTPTAPTILVVGGSLGARIFNTSLPQIFANLSTEFQAMQIVHQVGRGNAKSVNEAYASSNISSIVQLTVTEFIDDMASAFAQADIVICRAGALTVAEVACAGRVACFVPLPSAVDDHQTANAKTLSDQEGAILCPQSELASLGETLSQLLASPAQRIKMAQVAQQLAKPNATKDVCTIIKEIAA